MFLMVCALSAAPVNLNVGLTVGAEIPPPDVPPEFDPSGSALLSIDLDAATVSAMLDWSDMTSSVVAAHIHRINPMAATPGTGPVLVGFFMGVSFPQTSSFTTPAPIALTPAQVTALAAGFAAGDLYVNIHTMMNPPGEIRGDLGVIPEPGTVVLVSAGLALAILGSRRRKRLG
jgi:hypothetical protein